jgi:hypothetical protein
MNLDGVRRRFIPALLLLAILAGASGCAGAGPARGASGGRERCGSSGAPDEQRPLFFFLCVESP